MTKQAEREYAEKVDAEHLYRRPFDCPRVLREFGLVLEILGRHAPAGSVLDLGCGPGWTSLFLARAGYDVTGVDISERMIDIARDRSAAEGTPVRFLAADMEELDLDRRDFDAVLLFDSLHHCPGYGQVLRRAGAHLRRGGCLLLLEPTWLHRISPHAREASRRFGVTELGFTRWGLGKTLRQAGFRRVVNYYDPGSVFRGPLGVLAAWFRVAATFAWCFPRTKHIMLAEK